jgi:hypothetical protein
MRLSHTSIIGAVALALAGANAFAASAVPQIPPDWVTINAGGVFTLKAPPGSVFVHEAVALNNARGGVRGPGFEVQYQYALETDNLQCAIDAKNYAVQEIEVDSRKAVIITGSDVPKSCTDSEYANFVGLYHSTAAPSYTRPRFYTLTIWGSVAKQEYASTVKTIYQTIHFLQ